MGRRQRRRRSAHARARAFWSLTERIKATESAHTHTHGAMVYASLCPIGALCRAVQYPYPESSCARSGVFGIRWTGRAVLQHSVHVPRYAVARNGDTWPAISLSLTPSYTHSADTDAVVHDARSGVVAANTGFR
jgi:hypothetical protein